MILPKNFFINIWIWYLYALEAVEASQCYFFENRFIKLKCPTLLKPLATVIQQNYWSFYPSEPFTFTRYTMRHPVCSSTYIEVHSHTYLLHKINEAALKVTLTRPSFKPVCTVHVKVYQFWLGPRDVQTDDMGWEQLLLPWWSFFLPLCSTVDSFQQEQIKFRIITK